MAGTCLILLRPDGGVAARVYANSGTSAPAGWTAIPVDEEAACPPFPVCPSPPQAAGGAVSTDGDLRFKEWAEARATIGRLDTLLEDLRKVGFTIVIGLLTASTLFGLLGVPSGEKIPALPLELRESVFLLIGALVAALFTVDAYYAGLLTGAVERALDIETQTQPPIRLTKYLSFNATAARSFYGVLLAYLVLFLATYVPGRIMLGLTRTGLTSGLSDLYDRIGAGLFLYILVWFVWTGARTKMYRTKPRVWPEGPGKVAAP